MRPRSLIAALLLVLCASAARAHLFHDPFVRIYVIVIESLDPAGIGPATPTLSELRGQGGVWYEDARAVLPSSTLVNHAAIATGVLPRRSGIVADRFLAADGTARTADSPDLLEAPTLVTRLKTECDACIETATVVSGPSLHGLFSGAPRQPGRCDCAPGPAGQCAADFHQRPLPGLEREPDAVGMQDFANWALYQPTPQFGLLSLGDVAETGGVDAAGAAGVTPLRAAVLAHADAEIRYFVENLKALDFWKDTILFVVSDHGMDWSLPTDAVSLTPALEAAGFDAGEFRVVASGSSAMVYVTDPGDVEAVATAARAVPGVGLVLTDGSTPSRADFGLDHARAGEVVVFAADGHRIGDPSPAENPYAGNAGNPAAARSVVLVAGGHRALVGTTRAVAGERSGTMSVAATVAALFGLAAPPGGYDAPLLAEPFTEAALASGGGPCAP